MQHGKENLLVRDANLHFTELSVTGVLSMNGCLTLPLQLSVALQAPEKAGRKLNFQKRSGLCKNLPQSELVDIGELSRALRFVGQASCHLVDVSFVFDGEESLL